MGSTTVPKGLFGQSSYYIGYWDDDGSFRPLPVDTVVELEFRVSWASGRPSITGGTVDSADVSRAFCVANNRLFSYDIGNNVLDSTVVNTGVTSPSFGGGVYSNAVSYNFSYTPSTSSYLSFNLNSAEYVKVAELKTVEAVWTGTLSIEGTVTFEYDRTEKEIMEDINKDTTEIKEQAKEQTETQKGIFASIKEFFAGFFQNLIDSVIGLFVPSTEEMGGLFDELNQFFSDTFGFLYAPFDYLFRLVGVFTSSTGSTGLTFPGFSIMGYEVWPDMTYDIANDPVAGKVLEYVRMGTGVLLAGWFIMYLQDFFKERFGSGE